MSETESFSAYPGYAELAYACGSAPVLAGDLKTVPEDFLVEEILGFELSGEGEHLWLFIEATDMNTDFLVKQLARAFGLEKKAVSFSGKKDRRAVTRQWFSLHMPGRYLPGQPLELPEDIHEGARVLQATLHHKKLRRGAHQGNRFCIRLRQLQVVDRSREPFIEESLEQSLTIIAGQGFPNYFGPQRFGRQENNIREARSAITQGRRLKREQRDRVYSTLRAWDFNRQLSLRVAADSWRRYLPGDTLQLAGSNSVFQPECWDDELESRLQSGDIQIAGVLPGKGRRQLPLGSGWYEPAAELVQYLIRERVEQAHRPLAVIPQQLTWQCSNNELIVEFLLPGGAYATALLRELIHLREPV